MCAPRDLETAVTIGELRGGQGDSRYWRAQGGYDPAGGDAPAAKGGFANRDLMNQLRKAGQGDTPQLQDLYRR